MYCGVTDDENANGMGGDFVLAQQVGHNGGIVAAAAFPDDFIGRLRQVELPPRPAPNNRRSREAIASKAQSLQARHASCSSCPAYARPVIRSQLVVAEVELGHCREMREGATEVGCTGGLQVCVPEVEVGHCREMREGGT